MPSLLLGVVMALQDYGKMSKEDLVKVLAEQNKKIDAMSSGLIVKRTDKGGVYIKDTSFVEWSQNKIDKLEKAELEKKEKNSNYVIKEIKKDQGYYTSCINIGGNTAKALFGNQERLDQVITLVKGLL